MKKPPKTHPYIVQPVFKALKVLEFVAEKNRDVPLSEVASAMGLPKTTTFRYLRTLAATGFVSHDSNDDLYGVGPRFRVLSQIDRSLERLRRLALPVMADVGRAFNETVNLGIMSQGQVVYVEMIESSRSLRMQARIGDQHPLHSTALGKAILAHLPADERLLFLSLQLDSMTTRTVTDGSALQHQLKQVARRGYAIEVGENEDGSMCIGVPILDERDYPIAAISLSAPEQRMTTEIVPRAVDMLLRGAKNISERYRKAASIPE